LYVIVCLPNSIVLYNELDPLREEFVQVALSGYDSIVVVHAFDGPHVLLDYGGRLEIIISKRDQVLKQNYGILFGSWTAVMGTSPEVEAFVRAQVFCYNPFHKIELKQGTVSQYHFNYFHRKHANDTAKLILILGPGNDKKNILA
jgi:hypothetical protein